MKKVTWHRCGVPAEHTKRETCQQNQSSYLPLFFLHLLLCTDLFSSGNVLSLSNAGLKSMVEQGVRNPLVDLLSLEDKTLDEVG